MNDAAAAGCLVGPAVVGNRPSGSQELSSPGSDRRLREALAAMPKASTALLLGREANAAGSDQTGYGALKRQKVPLLAPIR
jgi:hypothetical protein